MKSLIFVFLTFFISSFALAEVLRSAEDISFDIPQGELTLPNIEPKEIRAPYYMGFELSNWEPDQLQQESRLPMTTKFEKAGSPKITFNYISEGADTGIGRISTKLGFSYLRLRREGKLGIESIDFTVNQNTNLYQGIIGTEWKTNQEYFSAVRPYADIALLPTWIQSQKSEFNGGISQVEWPLSFSAGALFHVRPLSQWLGVDEVALHVSVEKTQNLSGSSMNGTGMAVGTRIGWN